MEKPSISLFCSICESASMVICLSNSFRSVLFFSISKANCWACSKSNSDNNSTDNTDDTNSNNDTDDGSSDNGNDNSGDLILRSVNFEEYRILAEKAEWDIIGKKLLHNFVEIDGNVSSQYISALLLIGSSLKNGLEVNLKGQITSKPYIMMTLSLLNQLGVLYSFEDNIIKINRFNDLGVKKIIKVESDWSSASYYYSFVALSPINTEIILSSYNISSLQGDSVITKIYKEFGVETSFNDNSITIKKTKISKHTVAFDLNSSPDLAQTIAVTCLGLRINCSLTGLKTLLIKETNRLLALKNEIKKLGTDIVITSDTLSFNNPNQINNNVTIQTYEDHRMAMAFAPLSVLTNIIIKDPDVVSKSYPNFWNDLTKLGITINKS